ncbi:hypothetical protein PsYK624_073250 [Phanerochaete sordida]|uniref:Uncharacterized protein n=1 Tax=Phanerochaete sordida TaxID=48140 RepID=A0A9P3GA94_9APHY|nr:hypothetical protein PsYK624_073250 [Phanerochaete sordida]
MPVNGEPGRSSDDSDTSEHVQEAVAALNRLEVHDHMAQDGRITVTIEQADRAVDDVDRVEGSSYAPLAQDLVTYAVDNVKASCGVLVNVLDELSRVHPFVSVVALAFKTAIKLEMTRRENDKRVLALHAEMCNMMTVVALIRDFPADPQVNNALELRLSSRMKRIADDIKDCAAKCDSFQNKAVIVRLLTSFKWEETLNAFAAAFSAHKEDLHKDLVLLATSEIKAANVTLASVHAQVERVDLRLDLLRSPEELELLRFIDSKGGAQRVSEDDNLRQELDMEIERIGIDREDRLIGRVADLWEDVGKNLQITFTGLFYQNEDALERKFQLGLDRFENVLITTMRQVSFERTPTGSHCSEIIDTDLRQLWQDMGWHARPAVDEVIKNLLTRSLEHIHTPPGSQRSESPLASFYVEPEDPWASKYLSERWKQGLVEAIDLDGSAHVTIAELNSFSLSRPGGWSLPRWVAYWTVGSPLALIWYYKRIRELLKKIRPISANVLPINRAYIQRLLGEGVFYACDCLLSGVYKILYLLEEDASVFEKFEDFELSEEQKLRLAIQSVNYELDTPTTVALVIGNRCLDKMILPLLYIMVERCIETIQEASSAALQRDRVFALRTSLWTLLRSSYRRIDALKDMAASRNVDDVQALHRSVKHFSFGLYRYIYFNEKLGTCKYLRDEARSHEGYFTPGSSDAFIRSDGANGPSQDIPPATQVVSREPWVQDDVLEVVTNQDHDMHPFVQLCIEQSVMMPDGEPDDAFSLMAQAAVARVGRKDEIALEEIFQSGSHRPRRQDSLRLARALTEQDITILAQKYSLEQQRLYCRLVDNVVRRQVLHSPVMCDKCRRHTMNMTRLICLGCQETSERLSSKPRTLKNGKTTDYCSKCLFEDLMLDCAAALLSSSYHAFLQVRRFTYNKWDHAALDIARRRSLEESVAHAFLDEDLLVNEVTAPKFAASQGTEQRRSLPTCCMCGLWLSLPFWSCIDCTDLHVSRLQSCSREETQHPRPRGCI